MTNIVEANVGPSLNVCANTELINPKFLESLVTSVSARISMPGSIFGGISSVGQLFHKEGKEQRLLTHQFYSWVQVALWSLSGNWIRTPWQNTLISVCTGPRSR